MELLRLIKKTTGLITARDTNNCIIYKYAPLDTNTISNLINEIIYFNTVSNFDDPTDAAFRILTGGKAVDSKNLSPENVKKLYDFMKVKYINDAPEQEPMLTLVRVCDQLEDALKKYIGISCFSQHDICHICQLPQLSPLMLTHYSNRHSGIVIEYQCSKPEILKKVNYSPKYKYFNYADILNNIIPKEYPKHLEINDKVISPLRFKFEEWAYQNEYRIFYAPNESQNYSELGLQAKRIYLFRIESEKRYFRWDSKNSR